MNMTLANFGLGIAYIILTYLIGSIFILIFFKEKQSRGKKKVEK